MHGMQVAATLKENDPSMEIHALVRDRLKELIETFGVVDGFLPYNREGGLRELVALCRKLRSESFDYVLDFHGLARTGLMSAMCRAKNKVGRPDAREGATLFYKKLVPLPSDNSKRHTVEKLLEFCRVFAFEPALKGALRIPKTESLRKRVVENEPDPVVSIIPSSIRPERRWRGFDEFVSLLSKRIPDARILILGLDHNSQKALPDVIGNERLVDLRTGVSMLDLASLLQISDLAIGVDNDFVRMAAALGTKTLTLVGKTNIIYNGPYPVNTESNQIIGSPKNDLNLLSVEAVLEKSESLLFS